MIKTKNITIDDLREWGACWSERRLKKAFNGRESASMHEILSYDRLKAGEFVWLLLAQSPYDEYIDRVWSQLLQKENVTNKDVFQFHDRDLLIKETFRAYHMKSVVKYEYTGKELLDFGFTWFNNPNWIDKRVILDIRSLWNPTWYMLRAVPPNEQYRAEQLLIKGGWDLVVREMGGG
jgi:hypothetical protein